MNRKLLFPLVFILIVAFFSGVGSTFAEEGIVGVQVGESYEYIMYSSIIVRSTSTGNILLEDPLSPARNFIVTVQEIMGTNITLSFDDFDLRGEADYFYNGAVDVTTGVVLGGFFNREYEMGMLLISADSTEGDYLFPELPDLTIDSSYTKDYGGNSILINYMTWSPYPSQVWDLEHYWEKNTGMLLEYECNRVTNPAQTPWLEATTVTTHTIVERSNLLSPTVSPTPTPSTSPTPTASPTPTSTPETAFDFPIEIAGIGIVVIVGVAVIVFLLRKK